jgi:hypothetical protein
MLLKQPLMLQLSKQRLTGIQQQIRLRKLRLIAALKQRPTETLPQILLRKLAPTVALKRRLITLKLLLKATQRRQLREEKPLQKETLTEPQIPVQVKRQLRAIAKKPRPTNRLLKLVVKRQLIRLLLKQLLTLRQRLRHRSLQTETAVVHH